MEMQERRKHHFLVVAYPIQSHINPSLQMAKTLTRLGIHVTFSTAVFAHRRMFPDSPPTPVEDPSDPLLCFNPYSDGFDDGFDSKRDDVKDFSSSLKSVGSKTLHAIATATDPPVTCILYAMLFPWITDLADLLGIPSVLYWIQPAAIFAAYYHYFHGYREVITLHANDPTYEILLPGLPPLRPRDLPSFLVGGRGVNESTNEFVIAFFEEVFQTMDKSATKARVLVNTFDSIELDVIEAMADLVELLPIGPVVPSICLNRSDSMEVKIGRDVINETAKMEDCMEWLAAWPDRSVVYLSFGSISILERKQREEFARALVESGRPFLWVARQAREGMEEAEKVEWGKVVNWCDQAKVLTHKAVGCFVTHHGWNSTLEAMSCGVPMVGLPQWSDQPMNAKLVEEAWRVGVRAEMNGEGVVEGTELKRCLEVVMGDGEEGLQMRRRAEALKEKARKAVEEGGSSDKNIKTFVEELRSRC